MVNNSQNIGCLSRLWRHCIYCSLYCDVRGMKSHFATNCTEHVFLCNGLNSKLCRIISKSICTVVTIKYYLSTQFINSFYFSTKTSVLCRYCVSLLECIWCNSIRLLPTWESRPFWKTFVRKQL